MTPFMKKPLLLKAAIMKNTAAKTRKPAALSELVHEMIDKNGMTSKNIIMEFDGRLVRFVDIHMRKLDDKEFWKALKLNLRGFLGVDPKTVTAQFIPLSIDETNVNGKLIVIEKSNIAAVERNAKAIHMKLAHVGYAPLDMARIYVNEIQADDTALIVDLGAEHTNVALIHRNLPYYLGSTSIGMNSIPERLIRDYGLQEEQALDFRDRIGLTADVSSYQNIALSIRSEANKILQSMVDSITPTLTARNLTINKIAVIGGGSKMQGLPELIKEEVKAEEMMKADLNGLFDVNDQKLSTIDQAYYATLLGSARGWNA
jgi:cell division ATPase FtsA